MIFFLAVSYLVTIESSETAVKRHYRCLFAYILVYREREICSLMRLSTDTSSYKRQTVLFVSEREYVKDGIVARMWFAFKRTRVYATGSNGKS